MTTKGPVNLLLTYLAKHILACIGLDLCEGAVYSIGCTIEGLWQEKVIHTPAFPSTCGNSGPNESCTFIET
jgi:hypothetical protein